MFIAFESGPTLCAKQHITNGCTKRDSARSWNHQ